MVAEVIWEEDSSAPTVPMPTTWDNLNYLRCFCHRETEKEALPLPFQIRSACADGGMTWPFKGACFIFKVNERRVGKEGVKTQFRPPRNQQLRFILSGKWDYPDGLWLPDRTPNLHWCVFLPGPLCHAIWNDIERGGCRDTWRLTSSGQFAHERKRQVSRSPQMTAQPQSLFPDTGLWQSKMC